MLLNVQLQIHFQHSSNFFEVSYICLDTFLTRVTRDLVILRSTAVFRKDTGSLVTRVRKGIQADVRHFEQLA